MAANHDRSFYSLLMLLLIASLSSMIEARSLLESPIPLPQIPTLPKLEIPEFPKVEIPELPKLEIPELPKLEIPELPKLEFPELPKLEIPNFAEILPKPTLAQPDVPESP
ncbi:protein PELPK1-like [Salvia divinorum]|uniref:Protein PELPK1-like n=1 Tax=Salvia divinorum TaxID=28513 RepID=A0ABD1HBI9_SALDI